MGSANARLMCDGNHPPPSGVEPLMRSGLMVLLWLCIWTATAEAAVQRIDLPDFECNAIFMDVEGYEDTSQPSLDYAREALGRALFGGTNLAVLGAGHRAIFVLESYSTTDSGCEPNCKVLVLREIRFDGGRAGYDLTDGVDMTRDEFEDALAVQLEAALGRRGRRLRPVPFEVNTAPSPYPGSWSPWLLRIRDHVHKKSYVWRQRTTSTMCWCTKRLQLSTIVWRR